MEPIKYPQPGSRMERSRTQNLINYLGGIQIPQSASQTEKPNGVQVYFDSSRRDAEGAVIKDGDPRLRYLRATFQEFFEADYVTVDADKDVYLRLIEKSFQDLASLVK